MSADDILRHRLSLLPRKTGLVLQQLYLGTLLSPDSLNVILDAGDITGDANNLLGFAIACGDLRAGGVPVADTLSMAKRLDAKINLAWSGKRWKAEHDRLSRAMTLKRLSEENVRYDLSKYDKLIDTPFPGYLIRTSRRLGMEGLRQRHCVASYHEQIKAGYCAIASVFVAGERWTVELRLTGNSAHPLAIGQIRTYRNGTAGDGVREEIYGFFNVSTEAPAHQSYGGRQIERSYMDNARRVLPVLRANNVPRVTVCFDGCGDSGSISDVCFEGGDFNGKTTMAEIITIARNFADGRWVSDRTVGPKPVSDAIEEIVYDYLEETGIDWYNNDGGYGELVIDVESGTISLDVSTRYTESSTAYLEARDILTGEPID